MEKRCYLCEEVKPISDFYIDRTRMDGYRYLCKKCCYTEVKKLRKRKYQFVQDYKLSRGCAICGYNKCADALDFHHNGDKRFNIGVETGSKSLELTKEEMRKCIVLCANCHRELHAKMKLENNNERI